MKKISIKAVLIGTAVDIAGTLLAGIFLGILFVVIGIAQGSDLEKIDADFYTNVPFMLASLIIGLFFVILGAFIAGWIAPDHKILNGCMVGIIGIPLGLPFIGSLPLWYNLASYIFLIPAAFLGAFLATLLTKNKISASSPQ